MGPNSAMSYWDRIRDSKFKRLPDVYGHCALNAARTRVIFHTPTANILALLLIQTIVELLHFHILPTLELCRHWKFEK